MKKNILFVIDSLGCGGAEKSLVSLLSLIDYNKYNVDLLLFSRGGKNEIYIPKTVNILDVPDYLLPGQERCKLRKTERLKYLFHRITFSVKLRLFKLKTSNDQARLFWQSSRKCFKVLPKYYDVAISYAQRIPLFFVAEKTIAKHKCCWVNVGINLDKINKKYQQRYYYKFDKIIAVSKSAYKAFISTYPQLKDNCIIIHDIINPTFVNRLANEAQEVQFDQSCPAILTVARLNYQQKGYDILLDVCSKLKEKGLRFMWYAIGDGDKISDIIKTIKLKNLSDCFVLLGTTHNPYPYIKNATLYVQTSRYEGYGLSIAEARLLNTPVVTSEFDAVWCQMIQAKNGFVLPLNPTIIADKIAFLLQNPNELTKISNFQEKEKKGNLEEFEKFERLISTL